MKSIIKKMNEEIFGFIHHLDFDPKRARPVTFWFYSDNEERIYRLAAHLKNDGSRFTVHGVEGCKLNVEG